MKKILVLLLISATAFGQDKLEVISMEETRRIEATLSSDEMQGRRTFTPGIEKAGQFIAAEFEKIGLKKLGNSDSYLQSFAMIRPKVTSFNMEIKGLDAENTTISSVPKSLKFSVNSVQKSLSITEKSGYEIVSIPRGANFVNEWRKYSASAKNTVVFVDSTHEQIFGRATQRGGQFYQTQPNIVFVISNETPSRFKIEATQELTEMPLANVVGIIPGKSKANEYVIFSGHYDHLGINSRNMKDNDSIYNGANDDAAGTTAMIMLAKYYKALNQNERTLVFAAFTAEEIGGFGATYFSKQFDPKQVMAMFNIEMIGTESKWGKNSAYITGFDKTNMGEILQKNLAGTGFTFHPDPYPDQQLFYRSDNATLARLGVPAHTISTTKMDQEPHYHKASDEIGTLDMDNMSSIIKAIALSARGIVAGKETPTRVDISSLR
jgi:Zn-dependent M28 family amino/carboxypeptidase